MKKISLRDALVNGLISSVRDNGDRVKCYSQGYYCGSYSKSYYEAVMVSVLRERLLQDAGK